MLYMGGNFSPAELPKKDLEKNRPISFFGVMPIDSFDYLLEAFFVPNCAAVRLHR